DLTDTHHASASAPTFAWSGGTLTAAQQAALAAASTLTLSQTDSTGSGAGLIAFSYTAADKTFDFLAFGQTLTITYKVMVTDDHGVSTQPVIITVIGTNEAPVITSTAQTGAIIGDTNIDNSGNLNVGGTITFTDVNLPDTHTVTFTAGRNDYVGTFSLDPITQDSTNGQTGSVVWHFSVSDQVEDSLAAGQTLTPTYTVKVADNHGGFTTQDVTITIAGTNDAPVAVADIVAVNEDATASAATRSAGVLGNDTDPDTGETSTLVVSSILAGTSGTATALSGGTAVVNGTYGTLTIHSDGTYNYTPNNAAAEALPQGSPATDVFTYTAKDVHGATATTTLTFNITGQNDAPVITSGAAAGGARERGGGGRGLAEGGAGDAGGWPRQDEQHDRKRNDHRHGCGRRCADDDPGDAEYVADLRRGGDRVDAPGHRSHAGRQGRRDDDHHGHDHRCRRLQRDAERADR